MALKRSKHWAGARRSSAEAIAKVALLNYLRSTGALSCDVSVVQELGVGKLANRADLALIGEDLHCFEIKTRRDTLARLNQQVTAYSAVAARVSVMCATRHVNTALSRLSEHIGLLELLELGETPTVRLIREAHLSPSFSPHVALDFLPAAEIAKRLLPVERRLRRHELVQRCEHIDPLQVRDAVLSFLKIRYGPTSRDLLSSTRRRLIQVADLDRLRLWTKSSSSDAEPACLGEGQDTLTFRQIGTFGEVPEEVLRHLAA